MSLATQNHRGSPILTGLTAIGSSSATAFPLVKSGVHEFTTVASSSGAILPVPKLPSTVIVTNGGAHTLSVYPPTGGTVAGGGADAPYSLTAGSTAAFVASSLSNYYVESGSSGSSGITGLTGDVVTAAGSSGATAALLFGQASVATPSIASSQNDWNPTGYLSTGVLAANVIRASVTASGVNLTGLVPPTAAPDGVIVTLQNASASTNPLHLVTASSSSTASNRFAFTSDVWIDPGDAIQLQYDGAQSRWREFGPHKDFRSDLWGSGIDGAATISGPLTPTRDMYYTDLTIAAGAVITCTGFDIYVAGTLDLSAAPAGAIVWNGAVGGNGTSGTGGVAGGVTTAAGGILGGNGNGIAGGNGSTTNGSAGATATAHTTYSTQTSANGGAGGAGSIGTAGGAGAGTGPTSTLPQPTGFRTAFVFNANGVANVPFGGIGGASGGGGGGNGSGNSGGGGGAGGSSAGMIRIFARKINRGTNTNTSIITAIGGAGGNGAAGVASGGGGGGGGGGGQGGVVLIYHGGIFGSTITNAIEVTGGSGGAGGALSGGGANGNGGGGGPSGEALVFDVRTGTATWTAGIARTASQSGGVVTAVPATQKRADL